MTTYRVLLNGKCVLEVTDHKDAPRMAFKAAVRKGTELARKHGYGAVEIVTENHDNR